jgi:small-conductance mechanosensitive channel
MVDCSGGEFFVCQFYILLLQYQSSYQNDIPFLSATKACRSRMTPVSLSLFTLTQALLSFLVTLT